MADPWAEFKSAEPADPWAEFKPVEHARAVMGDVQAAPSSWAGHANVPAALLTGDEATDNQIGQSLAAHGNRRTVTPGDALRAAAVVGSLAVPEALPGMIGTTLGGALLSGGLSKSDNPLGVAWDAAKGGALSYGIGRVLKGTLGLIASRAQGKVADAAAKAAEMAAKEKDAEVRSLEGAARERTANAYRQMERIELALNNPALPAEERAALEAVKASPEYQSLVSANARSIASEAPSALGERDAARQIAQEARTALPDAIKARQAELLSPQQADEQIMARVKRYGMPALGSAVGSVIGGPAGGAVGALGGAGTRPMVHALRRMAQDPAVQTRLWGPLTNLGEDAAASPLPNAVALFSRKIPLPGVQWVPVPAAAQGDRQGASQ